MGELYHEVKFLLPPFQLGVQSNKVISSKTNVEFYVGM